MPGGDVIPLLSDIARVMKRAQLLQTLVVGFAETVVERVTQKCT